MIHFMNRARNLSSSIEFNDNSVSDFSRKNSHEGEGSASEESNDREIVVFERRKIPEN